MRCIRCSKPGDFPSGGQVRTLVAFCVLEVAFFLIVAATITRSNDTFAVDAREKAAMMDVIVPEADLVGLRHIRYRAAMLVLSERERLLAKWRATLSQIGPDKVETTFGDTFEHVNLYPPEDEVCSLLEQSIDSRDEILCDPRDCSREALVQLARW